MTYQALQIHKDDAGYRCTLQTLEDSTLPEASKDRACFMTSQPAALAKKASVSCKVDTGLEENEPGSKAEADQAFQGSVARGLARNPSALCPHL